MRFLSESLALVWKSARVTGISLAMELIRARIPTLEEVMREGMNNNCAARDTKACADGARVDARGGYSTMTRILFVAILGRGD